MGGSGVLIGGCEQSGETELDSLADLIDGLLEVDPDKRIPVGAALKHPFLTKVVRLILKLVLKKIITWVK